MNNYKQLPNYIYKKDNRLLEEYQLGGSSLTKTLIKIYYLQTIVMGLGKLVGQRLLMRRITRPAVQVLRHRKEATGDSPLFFNFTAVHKCRHLHGVCRRGVASTRKRVEGLVGD